MMESTGRKNTLVVAIALIVAVTAQAGEPVPSDEARVALREFVLGDCATGGDDGALDRLREHADALVPELERLLFEGPDAELSEESTRGLSAAWQRRQAFLDAGGDYRFDPSAQLRLRTTTREEYLARGRERFDLQCREKAAIGLLAIAPARTVRAIRLRADRIEGVPGARARAVLGSVRPLGGRSDRARGDRRAPTAAR